MVYDGFLSSELFLPPTHSQLAYFYKMYVTHHKDRLSLTMLRFLQLKGTWQWGEGLCINRFGIGPLHYISSRFDFVFKLAEIFIIKKLLGKSGSRFAFFNAKTPENPPRCHVPLTGGLFYPLLTSSRLNVPFQRPESWGFIITKYYFTEEFGLGLGFVESSFPNSCKYENLDSQWHWPHK